MSTSTSTARPTTPEELYDILATAVTNADVDTLVSLWETDSAFVMQPGQTGSGAEQLRGRFQYWLSTQPAGVTFRVGQLLQVGDLALALTPWSYTATTPDGSVPLEGIGTDVLRRQSDGTWKFVIDNPYGPAAVVSA
jgi:ketosteroid isomerase-like protein